MSHFLEDIAGHLVIPGTYTAEGGTTNFNIGNLLGQEGSAGRCVPFSTTPFPPDRDFVHRTEILAWMNDKCARPGARAALVGLGGVGKSQLAIQYCHNVRKESPQTFVFWVHASTRTRFEEAYRSLADKLALPRRHDPNVDVLRLVSDWLCDERNGQWMMVLDNADNVEIFFPSTQHMEDKSLEGPSTLLAAYLPQSCNGSILITSRNRDAAVKIAGGYKKVKDVPVMNESQGISLLRNKLVVTPTKEDAVALLHALDHLPLAISQAAAYINRRARMTVSDFLNEFRANNRKKESLLSWDIGDLRRDLSASNSVMTTWRRSIERIRQERVSAAELLSLMSFFNPQGIPESILRGYSSVTAGLGCEAEGGSTFHEDFDILRAYSFVNATDETDKCEMYALVQFCTQNWLSSSGDAERWKQEFVKLMEREFPSGEFETWAKCQQLLPHIEPLFDTEPATNGMLGEWSTILTDAAWYMQMRGNFETAQDLAIKAARARERVWGPNHRRTLESVTVLAAVLQGQGKYDQAENLGRQALEIYEKTLGGEHLDTLCTINNLALVLQDQGKYNEAEKLHRRALGGEEKALGVRHPDTLTSVHNLALVLERQEKYDEAEELYRQALDGAEKALGAQHPDTLMRMNNLANVLLFQGEFDEAEKLSRQALEGREQELGADHILTLTSANSLAMVVYEQGNSDEAKQLFQRSCDGLVRTIGSEHPTTIQCVRNFSIFRQEEEQARLKQSKRSIRNDDAFVSDRTCPEDRSGSASKGRKRRKR